ncbi:MAG: glycosyltransferase [Candidatus Thermoplasmatota archaeon]
MLLSVVLPTYNEAGNIARMVAAVREAMAGLDHEVLVIDDNSKDGTADLARQAGARVVVRTAERGLATAVVRGIAEARGTYVAVMDADFQHPPATVRRMVERAVARDADLVIGSRYVEGGTEGEFGLVRRTISRGASWLAHIALPAVRKFHLSDPMSGLFLVRRDRVDAAELKPRGYKVLLEVIAKARLERVEEVGYAFGARAEGDSKLGASTLIQYVLHLADLAVADRENRRMARFAAVGASGVLVNFLLLYLLFQVGGMEYHLALAFALEASVISNFLLNDRLTFQDHHEDPWWARLGLFHLVSFFGLVCSFATQSLLVDVFGVNRYLALPIGVVAGFVPNWMGNTRFTYGGRARPKTSRWLPYAILVVAASGLYLGGLGEIKDIYFDEHYYVSVAHQLDHGVLEDPCWANDGTLPERPLNYEHPPVAKLILWASVHAYDTYRGVFVGCRAPDSTDTVSPPCEVTATDGALLATGTSTKQCYDTFTQGLREQGNPMAWRGPAALFGIITVLFVALAARRIFQSELAGTLAGSFVLLDTLMVTSSRMAMLDIFAVGFAALALWSATFPTRRGVLGAGIFLGLGFASKYYVLFVGLPLLLLSLWVHWRAGRLTRRRFDLHLLGLPLIPLGVWIASYTPWWILWIREHGVAWAVEHWYLVQVEAVKWMAAGKQDHQYISQPIEWIPMFKPIFYIGSGTILQSGDWRSYIYAIGNPTVWWFGSLVAVGALVWFLASYAWACAARLQGPLRHFGGLPRWRQATLVTGLFPILVYGSFFALARSTFIFYMTLVVPFLALALAGVVDKLWHHPVRGARAAVVALLAAVVFCFFWFVPLALYIPIPRDYFHLLFKLVPWMNECGKDALCA